MTQPTRAGPLGFFFRLQTCQHGDTSMLDLHHTASIELLTGWIHHQKWKHQQTRYGYGSIPIIIPFLGGWTSIYQLFCCELQGYKVLTHPHMNRNEWIDTKRCIKVAKNPSWPNPGQDSTKDETEFAINEHDNLTMVKVDTIKKKHQPARIHVVMAIAQRYRKSKKKILPPTGWCHKWDFWLQSLYFMELRGKDGGNNRCPICFS